MRSKSVRVDTVGSILRFLERIKNAWPAERDTFELGESRADWLVKAVAAADHGDTILDRAPPSNG